MPAASSDLGASFSCFRSHLRQRVHPFMGMVDDSGSWSLGRVLVVRHGWPSRPTQIRVGPRYSAARNSIWGGRGNSQGVKYARTRTVVQFRMKECGFAVGDRADIAGLDSSCSPAAANSAFCHGATSAPANRPRSIGAALVVCSRRLDWWADAHGGSTKATLGGSAPAADPGRIQRWSSRSSR
ncbi:hypothetical protein N658DRAFT_265935 [Parathielavia hyrcaniae]|uniref:Uncharacterized protein n=1 Tax=Parathielavia hyrcaniae TaxID=113614 RepID=A0AAN6PTL0_9PEZI|nr:hypothetical protein N658DRAFT_265935 [Parathielavia hyrcaniae]